MNWVAFSGLVIAAWCNTLQAQFPAHIEIDDYNFGNYWSPYPPGCITVPLRQLDLYGDNVALIHDEEVYLDLVSKVPWQYGEDTNKNVTRVPMKIFRVACTEENRSVILVEFKLADNNDNPRASQIEVPDFVGNTAMHSFPFILKAEPNTHGQSIEHIVLSRRTFGDYNGGWWDAGYFTWRFILDVSPAGHIWGPYVSAYYNGGFGLGYVTSYRVFDSKTGFWGGYHRSIGLMPETRSVLEPNTQFPLNGRLSGNWIEEGTRDQGFLLSLSTQATGEPQPENAELLLFLAWYTFDSNGRMLWLTASASVPQGNDSANLQFVRVNDGQFLGDERAERAFVGNGQLQAKSCNLLELDYDLSGLGLGQGKIALSRVFALEIAGYHCRDYLARKESVFGKEGN